MLNRSFGSKKFLITGASGQIGQQLVPYLYSRYPTAEIIVSDLRQVLYNLKDQPNFTKLDVSVNFKQDKENFIEYVKKVKPTNLIHLSAVLSATAEKELERAVDVNLLGSLNALDAALAGKCSVYIPSTIAVFGPNISRINTPDDVVLQPTTVYGIAKVFMELMGNYYFSKFGLDFRSLRYPGAISCDPPGGGTTDYAVEIYFELLKHQKYECFLEKNTMLPMMYMDDLIRATVFCIQCDFIDADSSKLSRRVYNLAAISFTPEEIFDEIKKHIPDARISYKPDQRQAYADSWPMSLDDSLARKDWGWAHNYDIEKTTTTMLKLIKNKQSNK